MVKSNGFGQIVEEGDNAGFFKILRNEDLSSEIVRMIPHDLVRSIPENSSSFKMVLKVAWGSSWPVKISKNPSFHYMEDRGWNQFVKDNALGENEHLTFTHEANMCFNVTIYEPDGTEMRTPRKTANIASSSGSGLRKRARKKINKDVKEEEIESSFESSYPGLKTGGRLGKKKAEETEKSKKNNKKKKKKVDTGRNDSEAGTSSLVPEFTLTIKRSHLVFLSIPKKFMDHMPMETKTFKIHYLEGEEPWEVLFLVTDVQSRFSAGWSRFAEEIGLEVGDVCNFKLIKPTEMLVKISTEETP